MYSRRTFTTALGAVGVALTAPGLFSSRASAANSKTIRIGWQKNGVLALAKSQGALEETFKDQGIEITWSEFSSGPPLLEALGAGALDFGPTGDVPPLFAQAAGGNLLYVGTYAGTPAGSAILVHKDAPLQSLADLKGRKLAFKRGSSAHNFAIKALRKGGLAPDDVTLVDLSPTRWRPSGPARSMPGRSGIPISPLRRPSPRPACSRRPKGLSPPGATSSATARSPPKIRGS